jgi:hypothetical protein
MSLAEKYREIEADRKRMDFMLRNPDEAASAVSDAYDRWDGSDHDQWQNFLREELDYQTAKVKP